MERSAALALVLLALALSGTPHAAACTVPAPVPGECHPVCVDADRTTPSCAPGYLGQPPTFWFVLALLTVVLAAGAIAVVQMRRKVGK